MEKILQGTAFVFAKDDIDTDLIIPARYLTTSDEQELAWHVLEPLRSDNELLEAGGLKQIGDESDSQKTTANLVDIEKFKSPIVVAGANFGCGSSREHAVWALRGAGVKVVIAKSFARIFFRNAVNNGFLAIECLEALDKIKSKDSLEIDVAKGEIRNLSNNQLLTFHKIPDFVLDIREKGGLLNTIKN